MLCNSWDVTGTPCASLMMERLWPKKEVIMPNLHFQLNTLTALNSSSGAIETAYLLFNHKRHIVSICSTLIACFQLVLHTTSIFLTQYIKMLTSFSIYFARFWHVWHNMLLTWFSTMLLYFNNLLALLSKLLMF